jgi:hypothetical protein
MVLTESAVKMVCSLSFATEKRTGPGQLPNLECLLTVSGLTFKGKADHVGCLTAVNFEPKKWCVSIMLRSLARFSKIAARPMARAAPLMAIPSRAMSDKPDMSVKYVLTLQHLL